MNIGSSNVKTERRYKFGMLYFRFIETLLIKQKQISQKETCNPFIIRVLNFDFLASFQKY